MKTPEQKAEHARKAREWRAAHKNDPAYRTKVTAWRAAKNEALKKDPEAKEAHLVKHREYSKKWRSANVEKSKARSYRWRANNPEKSKEINRRQYWKNPEKARKENYECRKRLMHRYRPKIAAWARKYRKEHPEYRDQNRKWLKEQVDQLTDFYILELMGRPNANLITADEIELKRTLVLLKRIIKDPKYETKPKTTK